MNRGDGCPAPILFLGKRFYTNKDAWTERFGRVFRLPSEWARTGESVLLWLVDYHTRETVNFSEGRLTVWSRPILSLGMLAALLRAWRLRPVTVVASGDCYIGLLGWLLARAVGARFVFDIYDKYDEFTGYVRPFGFDLFGFLRRRADRRFYPSRSLAQLYEPETGGRGDAVIANGVDDAVFMPLPMDECRRRLDLDPAACLIGYFGAMEPDRGVADLIAAIAQLRADGEDVRLLLCGRENAATALDRDWIIFRGMVAHQEMPLYLNASDLLVVPYRSSPIMDMGASCKIAEYLMCRRPIASTRTPNFVGNFPAQAAELGQGMCEPGDVAGLTRAIAHQLRHKTVLSVPTDMAWSGIAAKALACLRSEFP